jgi:AsmA protein
VLGAEHKPIAIGRLQRHAMDFVYAKGIDMFQPGKATGKKVAVIGAGPAGLSCARTVYKNVELKATDVATTNNFPITFSMEGPGGGTMKIDGKVGPVDPKDAAFTPQDVKLTINNLNLASTGFLDPSLGLAGLVDIDAGLKSQGGKMSMKGKLTLSKAVLVQGGKPSGVPAIINFDTVYDLAAGSGMLNPSTLNIGNAKSNLSGTYKSVGDDFVVDMKIDGQGLPATDLESFLPALGVNLPSGSRLSAITLSTNLHVTGPTNKLMTDGNIGPFNGKLSTGLAGGKAVPRPT